MARTATAASSYETKLFQDIGSFALDPLGYVRYAFPWRVAGGPLQDEEGPEPWQRDVLQALGSGLVTVEQALRIAVASGHGIGKSALVAWILLWAMSTLPDTRGIVTANTEGQLRTKTWPELAKWYGLCLNRHWFVYTATALYAAFPGHDKTWRVDAVAWSEQNTEAIAGLHNKGKRAFALFDEASAIPDAVWETIEGALTDEGTELFWAAFGNPTRNTGRFRECFAGGRFGHRWQHRQIDGRSVSMTNKLQIESWAADYGDDSDFFRIRVKGQFPRGGSMQFIDGELVDAAMRRPVTTSLREAMVMGVDVARFGDDQTVIYFRRGLEGRYVKPRKFRGLDTMQVAAQVAQAARDEGAQAIFVDEGGIGAGVVDRLRQMRVPGLIGVNFGGKADRLILEEGQPGSANKRAEMWASMRTWLRMGAIPNDPELQADLTGVEYAYNIRNEIQLEAKEAMKKRGLSSPDIADALALTFAYPVMDLPDNRPGSDERFEASAGDRVESDYDIHAELE